MFLPFRRAQKPDSQQIQRGFAKGAASTKSTAFGLLWGSFPPFRRSKKPEIQQIRRGLGNGFRKRSGLHKTDNFWTLVGFPPFRRSQKPEIQQIRRGLGHGLLYEIDPSISAVPEAGIQQIRKGPGNGFRKRSGLYKIDNLWAFVGFPPSRTNLGRPRSGIYSSPSLLPTQTVKLIELAAVQRVHKNNLANLLKPKAVHPLRPTYF